MVVGLGKVAAAGAPLRTRLLYSSAIWSDVLCYRSVKYALDSLIAAFLLIVLLPVFAVVAAAVKLSSKGPVLHRQERLTKDWKIFTMYKFRTMIVDAERQTGPVFAAPTDPRITSVGRFLRAYRIDELPQLFNVLRGEMSLIGPRPERPEIAAKLLLEMPSFQYRLQERGGITGLAQVNCGYADSLDSYGRKLHWDNYYVEHCSPMLDLCIALRTVVAVVCRRGAR